MMLKSIAMLFFAVLTVCLMLAIPSGAVHAYHPAVQLLDKEGEIIDPINGENDSLPFSTKQTCGLCHDYDVITEGYHFQTGWDVISDTFGVSERKPWNLSNGMMGRWCVLSFRQMAKKENNHPDEIDLTPYNFIGEASYTKSGPTCGGCHAGGGGLEFDREGNRYDEYLAEDPDLRESLDGDYYQSDWDKSGVVEADCFICHYPDYNFEERIDQLRAHNYQWAVVAASGIGLVEGSVDDGDVPRVSYNKRFFNSDGTFVFSPSWPPPDDNCMFCHSRSDVKKRGFSWNDLHNPDVHQQQGMSCIQCHPAGEDHQLAKGDVSQSAVAPELDKTMTSCAECHYEGLYGASRPEHSSVRPSHLDRIACESCHIHTLRRAAINGIDITSGEQEFIINPRTAEMFGDTATWYPIYERRDDEKIYPFNSILTVWFANFDSDSIAYPLFAREHSEAWELYSDELPEEIIAGLKAVARSLEGNERFNIINPVFIKGGKGYVLDSNGELSQFEHTVKCDASLSISHNVSRRALGAGGCWDCHSRGAHFFKGQRVIDLYGEDGQPITKSIGRYWGCNPVAFEVNTFHQEFLSPIISIIMIAVMFFVILHYHSYGPKRIRFFAGALEIPRFTLFERGVHLFRLIAFVLLAITGLIMAFNWTDWQNLLFRSADQLLQTHIWTGIVFIITTVLGMIIWFEDALFASYDKDWVKRIGGYLGYKGEVPAGRFNAGQKMFYWYSAIFGILMSITGLMLIFKYSFSLTIICITSTTHNLFGFALIAGVLAHAYLGTIANPGTWRVLVDGHVTKEWAKHHHPNWYNMIMARMESEENDDDVSDESNGSETDE
jgi:formate dehydrogenase gamma subunit